MHPMMSVQHNGDGCSVQSGLRGEGNVSSPSAAATLYQFCCNVKLYTNRVLTRMGGFADSVLAVLVQDNFLPQQRL